MNTQPLGARSASERLYDFNSARLAPLSHNGSAALVLAIGGLPVFPVREAPPRLKAPYTEHGHRDATTDETTVRSWWSRWPGALVGIPTGPGSGLWVLDVDGPTGLRSLGELLNRLGLETFRDLARVVVRTPGGGLHLYFRLKPGERPRNRAKDIGAGLDTRGVTTGGQAAGYVIAPGSALPDGRSYDPIEAAGRRHLGGRVMTDPNSIADLLREALLAPRGLLYLSTFNQAQRRRIASDPDLKAAVQAATASDWPGIVDNHERQHRPPAAVTATEVPAMRRQALHDLAIEAERLAALTDGRRGAIFAAPARLAKYVAHGVLTASEVQEALSAVWIACGGGSKHGSEFACGAVRRALELGRSDPLPPLARQFRDQTKRPRVPVGNGPAARGGRRS